MAVERCVTVVSKKPKTKRVSPSRETRKNPRFPLDIITKILAILVPLVGVCFWFNGRIATVVEERLLPYQFLINGITLNLDNEYDLAVPKFEKALDLFIRQGASEETLVPVIDFYLDAVAYTDHPLDHEPDFQKLRKHIGITVPDKGWHHDRFAFFYMRTSRLAEAKLELERSLVMRKADKDTLNTDWTHWALALVNLAEDNVEQALGNAVAAARIDPIDYCLENWAVDLASFQNEYAVPGLIDLYPRIKTNLPAFFSAVSKHLTEQNSSLP